MARFKNTQQKSEPSSQSAIRSENLEIIAQDAAVLSVCEVGLGSLLHAFKIPMTGYFLSLNQIFFLARSTFKTKIRTAPMNISGIAAFFKSLSPAGDRLVPMLAISSQGFLMSVGTLVFGPNLLGVVLGGALSSLWAFLQPLMIYYFIFGNTIVKALQYFYDRLRESIHFFEVNESNLLLIGLSWVLLKALCAVILVFIAYFLPESAFQKWQKKILSTARRSTKSFAMQKLGEGEGQKLSVRENVVIALKSLLSPIFLISLALTVLFFVFVEASWAQIFWGAMRPVAIGFLVFFLIRYLPMQFLQKRHPVLGSALKKMKDLFD